MTNPNSVEVWDKIWAEEGSETWRATALNSVYSRICHLIGKGEKKIIDIGGGVGVLAKQLQELGHKAEVWEHSPAARAECEKQGITSCGVDLEDAHDDLFDEYVNTTQMEVVIATEVLEHLSLEALDRILSVVAADVVESGGSAFFSVPNDRLSSEEEPQHRSMWTAKQFLDLMKKYFKHVRVEVLGPPAQVGTFPSHRGQPAFLLAVCGKAAEKPYTLSFTMPVRDEASPYPPEENCCTDIERTVASFRGVADEMVIGIDPRSTDETETLVRKYADVVFTLENPLGPPEDQAKSIHFGWVRTQCIKKCTGDWIFMSEGHESLRTGQDVLLRLDDVVPKEAKACYVLRTGVSHDGHRDRWGYPWLAKQGIHYVRSTHNLPMFNGKQIYDIYAPALPQVKTLHKRVEKNGVERAKQRRTQNRITLLNDWSINKNENSLHYLGTEWRGYNDKKAIGYLQEFLALPNHNGAMRYQTRLALATLLMEEGSHKEAREVLILAAGDDWSRTDHYVRLGDLAFEQEKYEEALQWYLLGATRVGDPPFTIWWIDEAFYSYLPCQRLAMAYSYLGRYEESLLWAKRVLEHFPEEDIPEVALKEAKEIVEKLEEAIQEQEAAQ